MASQTQRLYVGVTNNLQRRVSEHRNDLVDGFTSKYKMHRLVFFESTTDIRAAIAREKQIKGWLRRRKIELIEGQNPQWHDLAEEWFKEEAISRDSSGRRRPSE
jgi:putative endonuclease